MFSAGMLEAYTDIVEEMVAYRLETFNTSNEIYYLRQGDSIRTVIIYQRDLDELFQKRMV